MSWLPDTASFHERVQDAYAVFGGRALVLSANDVDLVDSWAKAEVPFEIVARGMRKAAEALAYDAPGGEARPASLRAFKRHVDAEMGKYLKRTVGRTEGEAPTPFHLERHKKLLAALRKLATEVPALNQHFTALRANLPPPADFDAADRQESLVLAVAWQALPTEGRRECLRRTRALVQEAALASASTRREALRFHRAAWVRQHFNLPTFW